jgi:hypothetical protein
LSEPVCFQDREYRIYFAGFSEAAGGSDSGNGRYGFAP